MVCLELNLGGGVHREEEALYFGRFQAPLKIGGPQGGYEGFVVDAQCEPEEAPTLPFSQQGTSKVF